VRCGRCTETRCAEHAFSAGRRCQRCEHDYAADEPTRRAAKLMFAPPMAILAGGLIFGILLPISFGGAIGAAIMGMFACGIAFGTGAAMCTLVDRSARALFLREKAGELPVARLLPAPTPRSKLLRPRTL
jgi:predicted lipid-binding transport protein (Tim44 family)